MRIYDQEPGMPASTGEPLVVPLDSVDQSWLPLVGGKAAHLGELMRAGFAVPEGYCVTTAAYALVAAGAGIAPLLDELAVLGAKDTAGQARLAGQIRTALLQAPVPEALMAAIRRAYQALAAGTEPPLAVRSSATAEDLPGASFAGQQETYLNVVGGAALLEAVRRCFASLWTDRAVSYRAVQGIDPRTVQLAAVVQCMVDAQLAGVLFTADPITGRRARALIDANPGLGEAVVAGLTNPDHCVVDTPTGEILERHPGSKQLVVRPAPGGGTEAVPRGDSSDTSCLSDAQLRTLAGLGARVELLEGAPQDIEWAIDAAGQVWLLQTRPITTLFPLPADAPPVTGELRVYLCFNVQQGTYRPFTPMGIAAVRVLAGSLADLFGFPPPAALAGPRSITEAAGRIFLDVTGALRSQPGRSILARITEEAEPLAAAVFRQLSTDPRLALLPAPRLPILLGIGLALVHTGLPWHIAGALLAPRSGRPRLRRLLRSLRAAGHLPKGATAEESLAAAERLLSEQAPRVMSSASPGMLGGMISLTLARRLIGDQASEAELQVVLRGLPFDPTSAMNLELAALAAKVCGDPPLRAQVQSTPPTELAEQYRRGQLPAPLQRGLAGFLARYGHRSVSEFDLGMPRWSEDPTYVLQILSGFVGLCDPAQAPEALYQRAMQEAEAMVQTLANRAGRSGRLRRWLAGKCLRRARALGGQREVPRFCLSLLLAQARHLLRQAGDDLVRRGALEQADDIFFLTLDEAHATLAGTSPQATINARRGEYQRELARRHVPTVMLSDGTEPAIASQSPGAGETTLRGVPASPGIVTALARVIHDPHAARLERGEILVAPATDPGWTPLFFTAAGLVMETGGVMAHGAIVAREYGIPAVVGAPQATQRIHDTSRITVDGRTGVITLHPPGSGSEDTKTDSP